MQRLILSALLALKAVLSFAQFPPTPSDVTVVQSRIDPAVNISFKEIKTEICKQPSGSKTYSGFVHLPGSVLGDLGGFPINTYFLYFEARNSPSTAPLAVYLAGGAGESSTYTALSSESGPCYVNYEGTDTVPNPYSFNEHVNMLYIDQPVQTGFSYGTLIKGTYDFLSEDITPLKSTPPVVNASFGYGTYPSQDYHHTTNTTVTSAKALWYFAEHWLSSFPGYKTESSKISVWGNSYGGFWVPETAAQFSKNLKALSSDHVLKSKCLAIDTIGITNGCIDFVTGAEGWIEFAYNNTYGVQFASKAEYDTAMHNLTKPGGCLDLVEECRALGEAGDPNFTGNNATVNKLCTGSFEICAEIIFSFPKLTKRDPFDTATIGNPCPWWLHVKTYLDTASVQQDLGVPLNFTEDSTIVTSVFGLDIPSTRPLSASTGDPARQNGIPDLEYLLQDGVKVAFIFGDRDYRCPWLGGEATALATKWKHQADFANAGYEELKGTTKRGTDHGAVVKQYGQFSFSRVLDAGHAVSAYAPETVYRIFERTMLGLDVVTGKEKAGPGYHTTGPKTSWRWRNEYPEPPPETCIVQGRFTERNPWKAVGGVS